MSDASLIEDIITTKNTLTILRQVFNANRASLQPFSPIVGSITTLIDVLTNASVKHIEAKLQSTSSKDGGYFNKLRETLNEVSEAISTKDTSRISRLNEELNDYLQQLQIDSATVKGGETADDQFKRKIAQSNVHRIVERISERYDSLQTLEEDKNGTAIVDEFAKFRFARRIRNPGSSKREETAAVPASLPTPVKPRLMISYNHASKPLCIDLHDRLTKDGYEVWIDFKHMHGSTLMAMAQGIEDSDIIIFCMTENYSKSPNCQKEAEYAFVRQKVMVPLLLQSKYKPTGWLGFLLGASFYIDFTKNDFTQNYAKLKSEIKANAKRIGSNRNDAGTLTSASTTVSPVETPRNMGGRLVQPAGANSVITGNKSRSCTVL